MPKGSANANKTHCSKGHEFTEENTQRHGPENRYRKCRACVQARNKGTGRGWEASKTHCKHGHEFTEENTYRFGPEDRYRACRQCTLDRAKSAYWADPEKFKLQRRRFAYGLSLDDMRALWVNQNKACAVCQIPGPDPAEDHAADVRSFWVVDHDHRCCDGWRSCGQCVRGLLCAGCNRALGFLQDSPAIARGAAAYLERFEP